MMSGPPDCFLPGRSLGNDPDRPLLVETIYGALDNRPDVVDSPGSPVAGEASSEVEIDVSGVGADAGVHTSGVVDDSESPSSEAVILSTSGDYNNTRLQYCNNKGY